MVVNRCCPFVFRCNASLVEQWNVLPRVSWFHSFIFWQCTMIGTASCIYIVAHSRCRDFCTAVTIVTFRRQLNTFLNSQTKLLWWLRLGQSFIQAPFSGTYPPKLRKFFNFRIHRTVKFLLGRLSIRLLFELSIGTVTFDLGWPWTVLDLRHRILP